MLFRFFNLDKISAKLIYVAVAVLIIALAIIIFYPAPRIGNKTTDRLSSSFSNREEKINFLENYIKLPSEIEDCEYHIVYYAPSGFSFAAEWSFKMMLKLKADNLKIWLSQAQESKTGFDLSWVKELPKVKLPSSKAKYYQLKTGELTVFEKESLLFWKVSNIVEE